MAISDRARDFWDRISPRERNLVVLLIVAAPITLAIWLGFAISDGLGTIEKRNTDMRRALEIVENAQANGTPVAPVDDTVTTMPADVVSLNTYLTSAATKAQISLSGPVSPKGKGDKNGFRSETWGCAVSDVTLDALKKFLQEIETENKHTVVTYLDVHKNFKNSKDGHLDATLEVTTYAKAKPAAGSGSGSGSGGSGSGDKKGT